MRIKSFIVFPLLLVMVVYIPFSGQTSVIASEKIFIEGEHMKGENLTRGFNRGVSYMTPGKSTAHDILNITSDGLYQIYARVYFTWANNEHLVITIGEKDLIAGKNIHHAFRWDMGNYQVWHWVKVGEINLKTGQHKIKVKGAGWLDHLVFYKGISTAAWRESWLAGKEANAAGKSTEFRTRGDIVFKPSKWKTTGQAQIKNLSDTSACLLQEEGASALHRFSLQHGGEFELWARLYFYNKNMFEGRTMQEMQNNAYIMIDGCLEGTVMEQNRRRWTWYQIGTINLEKGEHLLSLSHRGTPILVEKVVLKRPKGRVEKRDWYNKSLSALLPFGIPGSTDPLLAKRAGHWLMLGPLGSLANGKWLGEKTENKSQVVEVKLPEQIGRLVMEVNKPIECSPALQPQIAGFYCKGDIEGLDFSMILLDRKGKSWLAPCRIIKAENGWSYCYFFMAPARPAGANTLGRGNSGRLPDPIMENNPFSRSRLALLTEQQPMPAEWGVFELTHLIIDSTNERARKIQISNPVFSDPIKAHISGKIENGQSRLTFQILNNSLHNLKVELHIRPGILGENISIKEAQLHWRRFVIPVPGKGKKQVEISLPVSKNGNNIVNYRIGMGEVKSFRLPDTKTVQQSIFNQELAQTLKNNCAYEERLWKRNIPLDTVSYHYGKDLRILVDKLDVTSLEYAEQQNSIKPFRVIGYDLSDANGWPEIHVEPGEIAYDPRFGRIKFSEGYNGPCEVVGSYPTGFGVPGGGSPAFFGNYAIIPGGEGNFSVFDITRNDRPIPAGMVPSWYFEYDALKLDNFLFFNSSHRGFTLIDDLSNPTRPGVLRRVELDVERWGRVRAIDENLKLLLCDSVKDNSITVFSLENPLHPKLRGKAENCGNPTPTGQFGQYIVKTDRGLALLDIRNPDAPQKIIEWQFPEGREEWEKAKILAVSENKIACRLSNTNVNVGKRKESRAVVICITYKAMDAERGFDMLGKPCKDLPASRSILAAFHKNYLYLLNGWSGSGQYGINAKAPHSEWYTYRILKDKIEKTGEKLVDEFPTAYSQMKIMGNRAYVTEYNLGMWMFDLSNPARPEKIARYYGAAEGDALYVKDKQAYYWQTFGGQIYNIDCTKPYKPFCRNVYWDGVWVSYQNRFRGANTISGKENVIYSPRSGKGLAVIDISNPIKPRQIKVINHPNNIYGHCNFRIRSNIMAVTQKEQVQNKDGKKQLKHVVRFYDVNDPRNPQLLGDIITKAGSALYWKGSYLYMVEGHWLTIVNTSNPRNPEIASEIDLKSSLPQFGKAFVRGIAIGNNIAYISAGKGKQASLMVLVDVSKPEQPKPIRIFDSITDYLPTECSESWANFYQDLVIRGDMLFSGSYGRIECFDISKPLFPKLVAQKDLGFQWSVGTLEGDYLYIPGLAEFILLKVPSSPQRPRGQLKVE